MYTEDISNTDSGCPRIELTSTNVLKDTNIKKVVNILILVCQDHCFDSKLVNYSNIQINCSGGINIHTQEPKTYKSAFCSNILCMYDILSKWLVFSICSKTEKLNSEINNSCTQLVTASTKIEVLQILKTLELKL